MTLAERERDKIILFNEAIDLNWISLFFCWEITEERRNLKSQDP